MFPGCSFIEPAIEPKPNIVQFQFSNEKELTWLSMGNMIVNMYEHFENTEKHTSIGHTFDFVDLFKEETKNTETLIAEDQSEEEPAVAINVLENNVEEIKGAEVHENNLKSENSNSDPDSTKFAVPTPSDTQASAGTPTEVCAEEENDTKDENASRPKQSRRRGSDLQFLEQWCYWDRSRKYSQRRKNPQNERNDNETTINGILRKILSKYFE